MLQAAGLDIAVLEATVRYLRPVRFDDLVDVHVLLGRATRTTFEIGYLLVVEGVAVSVGVTVHGCVDRNARPARLPEWLRQLGSAD